MIDVLRRKLHHLARGEEGVALVVTLALFMFLYVSCAGVFSVGRAVKERIILQNAVDAAAYSAAMIEADTLSRIATINRAMAWTYKSLVCCQMDWIALKTLSKTHADYLEDAAQASQIGAYLTPPATVGIQDGSQTTTPLEAKLAVDLARMSDDAVTLQGKIEEYIEELEEMNEAIRDLKTGMREKIETTVREVLEANLPTRIGDLCRLKTKVCDGGELLTEMASDDEDEFVAFADETVADFSQQDWFNQQGSISFTRGFVGILNTFWKWQERTFPYLIHDEHVNAEEFRLEFPEAYDAYTARPQVLVPEYFPSGEPIAGHVPKGAITVAVAKKNENPWQGMTDCDGFYAAFNHSDATEWSIVISSAQAGYRNRVDEEGEESPAYSLFPVGYDDWDRAKQGPYWNLASPDWNAVFIPIRKAFKRGAGDDTLEGWMRDGDWARLVSNPKYVPNLDDFDFANVNRRALPRMHNSGGSENVLDWGNDDFLDLFYH